MFAFTKNIVVAQFLKIQADNCLISHHLFIVCNLATLQHEVQTTHTVVKNHVHKVAGDVGSSTATAENNFKAPVYFSNFRASLDHLKDSCYTRICTTISNTKHSVLCPYC